MGRSFESIPDHLATWMVDQPVFFVATAPAGGEGRVNLSPKGDDTFRVVDERTVAYLDLTGSGAETIAHLRHDGRITVMFCSFDASPLILRLYGRGRTVLPGDGGWEALRDRFPLRKGTRAVIVVDVDRVSTSCGYAVPMMDLVGERTTLTEWADRKEPEELDEYRATRNATSIDGLPALDPG